MSQLPIDLLKRALTPIRNFTQMGAQFPSDYIDDITNIEFDTRFSFNRSEKLVKSHDTADSIDPDEQDWEGLLIFPNAYFRAVEDKKNGIFHLFAARKSKFLLGAGENNNPISKNLDHNYLVSSIKTDGSARENEKILKKFRHKAEKFNKQLGRQMEDYFTLNAIQLKDGNELFANKSYAYLIKKNKKGKFEIIFKDRQFEPENISKKSKLTRIFSDVSAVIDTTDNYEMARNIVMQHWQSMTSNTWDGKRPYDHKLMHVKGFLAKIYNGARHHGKEALAVHLTIGLGMGILNPKYTIVSALAAAFVHTGAHLGLGHGYKSAEKIAKHKIGQSKKTLELQDVPSGTDVSHLFKISTLENYLRLAQKIDQEKLDLNQLSYLGIENGFMKDHEKPISNFRPNSLKPYILTLHQREASSLRMELDDNTELNIFQNGLIRLMQKDNESGKITVFTTHRKDACMNKNVRLSSEHEEAIQDKTLFFEYDPRGNSFYDSFTSIHTATDNDLKEILGKYTDGQRLKDNIQTVLTAFSPSTELENANPMHMGGQSVPLPKVA